MLAPLPQRFGAYVVHAKLATGGMGEVFLATRVGAARGTPPLVLKILLPEYAGDATFVGMFHDEARIGMRLSHPNVAAVHDIGRVGDDHYLVLEFVHGVDLRQLQHRMRLAREAFPTETVLRIGLECLQALDHAHRAKDENGRPLHLVHRDLSPENVMVSYDGDVKVLDFGIARAEGRAVVTRAGHVKGKTGYMSPEQATGLTVDGRTDLYALALVMLELISGERRFPIDGDKFEEVRLARTWTPKPPSTWDKSITPAVDAVFLKALEIDREKRYQTADEFLRDLNKALREYRSTLRVRTEALPELVLRHFPDRAEPFLENSKPEAPAAPAGPFLAYADDVSSGRLEVLFDEADAKKTGTMDILPPPAVAAPARVKPSPVVPAANPAEAATIPPDRTDSTAPSARVPAAPPNEDRTLRVENPNVRRPAPSRRVAPARMATSETPPGLRYAVLVPAVLALLAILAVAGWYVSISPR